MNEIEHFKHMIAKLKEEVEVAWDHNRFLQKIIEELGGGDKNDDPCY